jgi:hypothetical protein
MLRHWSYSEAAANQEDNNQNRNGNAQKPQDEIFSHGYSFALSAAPELLLGSGTAR